MWHFLIEAGISLRNWGMVDWPLLRLRLLRKMRGAAPARNLRYLVLPADPYNPSGSLGDVAMLSALVGLVREQHPSAVFTIVGQRAAQLDLPGAGQVPVVAAWHERKAIENFDRLVREHDALFVLGADVLDGQYGAALVHRIVSYCNHAARLGVPVTILGFSFNARPRRSCVRALSHLDASVRLCLRDPISFARFRHRVRVAGELCADIAFLLPPSEQKAEIEEWISQRRAQKPLLIGVNINAHAFGRVIGQIGTDALVHRIADQLSAAQQWGKLAYLLLPHDLKAQSGDITLLKALEKALRARGVQDVVYWETTDPAQIKRVTGQLDLVVTGRMHLAIGALGARTPVLAIAYQDKFEGLCEHFRLPAETILYPEECLSGLAERLIFALDRREDTRRRIESRLPEVIALARRNVFTDDERMAPGR